MVSDHANLNESLLGDTARPDKKSNNRKIMICVGLTLVVVGVVIALIFGVGPKIAQNTVDATSIDIDRMAVYQVDPDTFHIDVATTITNPSILGGEMEDTTIRMYAKMNGTNLLIGEVPFPALTIPGKGSVTNKVSANMKLTGDLRLGIHDFIAKSLVEKDLEVTLEATLDLKSTGLTFKDLTLRKDIIMKGMDHLNVTVTNFSITDFDTFAYAGTTNYHNPSHFEILMGNLTMDTNFQGRDAGNVLMTDVYIAKGTSYAPCSGKLPVGLQTREKATAFRDMVNGVPGAKQELARHLGLAAAELGSDPFGVLICTFIKNGTAYSNINQALVGIPINATLYPPDPP